MPVPGKVLSELALPLRVGAPILVRLDTLVALVDDRHGLTLLPDGRLAPAETRVVVRAASLAGAPPNWALRGLPAPGSRARARGSRARR